MKRKMKKANQKQAIRPEFVTHSVAPLALSAVYAYYFSDDEVLDSYDDLDVHAYEQWVAEQNA